MLLRIALCLLLFSVESVASFAMSEGTSILTQRAKSTSPHVGAAMAVLATLEQSQVLPPEGSREADRIIQSVIQLQSVLAKGTDPSIQKFAQQALSHAHGTNASMVFERFRANGWTANMLEALAEAEQRASTDEQQELSPGLSQVNLSVDDFRRLMQLVRDGRSALEARGQSFQEVYAYHRKAMPGSVAQERQ